MTGEATLVSEGTTCLLLVMPVISGMGAPLLQSVEEREELAWKESPLQRFLLLRARTLSPLPSVPPTSSPVTARGAATFCVTCAAARQAVMAGRVSS